MKGARVDSGKWIYYNLTDVNEKEPIDFGDLSEKLQTWADELPEIFSNRTAFLKFKYEEEGSLVIIAKRDGINYLKS